MLVAKNLPEIATKTTLSKAVKPSRFLYCIFCRTGRRDAQLLVALHPALLEPTVKIYVARLLTMFDEGESTLPARLANDPIGNLPPKSQNLLEPLSERELEILRQPRWETDACHCPIPAGKLVDCIHRPDCKCQNEFLYFAETGVSNSDITLVRV